MKTTLMFRQMIANPRRTTLAHLKDATELGVAPPAPETDAAAVRELPQSTANPRRTVLNELPKSHVEG
ncbi:hypothetical protein OG900_11755 [Streptomyces sp. NBC_00433]